MSVFPKKNVWLCTACFVICWALLFGNAALAGKSEVPLELNAWHVEMTSQTWHGIVWKHNMIVVRPKTLRFHDSAVLFISGGRNGQKPGAGDWRLAEMPAENTGSHIALLFQVPNQPLFFNTEHAERWNTRTSVFSVFSRLPR
ncbi:MAG: PhoPQ-activated pathogenicity-related family protein [Planctomycetaceae bacterium]|nr:PhoPQ-activated pathogenicity-related family protein [Planctomycetaceae bacterium]